MVSLYACTGRKGMPRGQKQPLSPCWIWLCHNADRCGQKSGHPKIATEAGNDQERSCNLLVLSTFFRGGGGIPCVLCPPVAEARLQVWSEDAAVPELLPVLRSFIPSETRGLFFLYLRHPGCIQGEGNSGGPVEGSSLPTVPN